MQQTVVSVVLPIPRAGVADLQGMIDALRDSLAPDYQTLRDSLPALHFMSMMLFDERAGVAPGDIDVSPLFVIEANFDGAPGPFWGQFEAAIGAPFRDLLRCCAVPLGVCDPMFEAVTAPGARAPIAPLLERYSHFPAASHAGVRGMSRDRILYHDALFKAAQAALPPPDAVRAEGAAAIHAWLRAALLPAFPALESLWVEPITSAEKSGDVRSLLGFGLLTLLGALAPWFVLALLLRPLTPHAAADAAIVAALIGAVCAAGLQDIGDLLTLLQRPARHDLWRIILAAMLLLALLAAFAVRGAGGWAMLALSGLLASTLLLLALLRRHEKQDGAPADSVPDAQSVHDLQAWEDLHICGSDHMGSVVVIKAGAFRAFFLRFAMRALTLVVRLTARDGYLGSMRTIHFAHWAITDGGRRLLFFSNFDGSWESYLDDFIEKAHAGLTLAWGNCVGFPEPEYCSLQGALRGRKFKAWARCSMAQSRFWYAAYPNLTVNQIWRQARVARGLTAQRLRPELAATWAKDL